MPTQPAQHPCCCYENSTAAKSLNDLSEPSSLIEVIAILDEVASAQCTLLGDLFGMDAKQERTRRYPQRAPTKLYGVLAAGCNGFEFKFLSLILGRMVGDERFEPADR